MAITSATPIDDNGLLYDKLAVHLALGPLQHDDGFGTSIAVRLIPYRVGPDGPEKLDNQTRTVVYGDATQDARYDPALAAF